MYTDLECKSSILALPDETLLDTIGLLDVDSVYSVRKTCQRLYSITFSKVLWCEILQRLRSDRKTKESANVLLQWLDVPVHELERKATAIFRTNQNWLKRRTIYFQVAVPFDSIVAPKMFDEQWLLLASIEGHVGLADLSRVRHSSNSLRTRAHSGPVNGCVARWDESQRSIILVVTGRNQATHDGTAVLIRLKLPDEQDIGQQMLKHRRVNFHLHTSAVIHDIGKGIIKNLLAFIDGRTIIVTNYITNARLRIRVHAHDRYDEFLDTMIAVRFCGPCLLCIKAYSIELYELPSFLYETKNEVGIQVLREPTATYWFRTNMFRQVSMSDYTESGDSGSIRILLLDDSSGMYLYEVQTTPSFNVILVGQYLKRWKESFVRELALGTSGRRGVWIERRRSDMQQIVTAFNAPDDSDESTIFSEQGPRSITTSVILETKSYDLRDDLIFCTLSETTGRVVLGKRSGAVIVLDCWQPKEY